MHERMEHYDPAEVLGWLRGMQDEIAAYAGRMTSMCDAAVDEAQFRGLRDDLDRRGFELHRHEALADPADDMPLAWSLIARRTNSESGPWPLLHGRFDALNGFAFLADEAAGKAEPGAQAEIVVGGRRVGHEAILEQMGSGRDRCRGRDVPNREGFERPRGGND